MGISTHILDTTRGQPAEGVAVTLDFLQDSAWQRLGSGTTDADGRVKGLVTDPPAAGIYRITFSVSAYFDRLGMLAFYPEVQIQFHVRPGAGDHYHVPLLLNPFGYSTYRGS